MTIKKEPFRKYDLDNPKADVLAVRLNSDERYRLNRVKKILNQKKDSTAIKQLMEIGEIVLHDGLTGRILESLFKNKRNNERLGISDYD
jgi:hypothetical protein